MKRLIFLLSLCLLASPAFANEPALRLLFLGDKGHHEPAKRFEILAPVMARRGIALEYTEEVNRLAPDSLNKFDGLVLYANIDAIKPEHADSLLQFVDSGKGFIPLHCATYCFRNSPKVVALMGAQFQKHGTGVMTTEPSDAAHPILKGYRSFTSWDETYVHQLHNTDNRTVLEYRRGGMQSEGNDREPWTWTRTHGKGRVFYTAWGHDHRTWGQAGFQNLVERGIRWACGDDPALAGVYRATFPTPATTPPRNDVKPFEYIDVGAEIPNYVPSEKWGVQKKPLNMMQKPLPAEESLKHLRTPVGFRVELFVAEPDLGGKPICMAWDERGRLWVAETYDYPNELQSPGEGRDRIRICEDTDGDGRADKFTVFAEKLSIPTSITFHRGGAIVQNGVETLYLKDTDGDDKADERRVLFSNWSLGDTHGGVSNFQYGLDNWIWAMQGYNNSRPKTTSTDEATQAFRMGFFRFRPDGSELEFIRSTNNNTWGLGISEEGLIFGSTANRNPSNFMPIPNRYYESVRGWAPSLTLAPIADTHLFKPVTENIRQVDHHGGYTAAAGHALYTARSYPQEYWNRTAFVCGPTGKLVGTFVLSEKGSGFTSTSPFNLVASDDEWTAPIMAEVGPDGCVWVVDWYNYIVQHNPTPEGFKTGKGRAYESKLRDKKHGRIYRVVYGDGKASKHSIPNLAKATPKELVEALKHPAMIVRKHAQRLLVERGELDVVPALTLLAKDQSIDEVGLNVGVIHALWTLHGLGVIGSDDLAVSGAVASALRHPSAGVRRNAVQVLPNLKGSIILLAGANKMLKDSSPHVRVAALLAIADLQPNHLSADQVLEAINDPGNADDSWIADALTCAAAHNSQYFLLAAAKSKPSPRLLETLKVVANHFARGDKKGELYEIVNALQVADSTIAEAVVLGLNQGWSKQETVSMTPEFEKGIATLLGHLPARSQGVLVTLATRWGSKELAKHTDQIAAALLTQVRSSTIAPADRVAAASKFIELQPTNDEAAKLLLREISPRLSPEIAAGFVGALEASRATGTGKQLIESLKLMTPGARSKAVSVILKRPDFTRAYLKAAQSGSVSLDELALDQKQALANYPDNSIQKTARELLARGGSLPNADREKVLQDLISVADEKGDAEAGKAVFKKHCAKCHRHGSEGENIGPDLTGMAVHPKKELLTQIIDPSRNVEGNYRIYTVITETGKLLNGMLASESKTAIELFDSEGKKHSILREDIDELIRSRKSLMPEGFEKDIQRSEFADLLAFLTKRGKFLPLDLAKVATIASDRSMFTQAGVNHERLIFPEWKPQTFKGTPFHLIDPQDGKTPNVVLLYGPQGGITKKMPKQAELAVNGEVKAIHLLSGVSGWGSPLGQKGSVSLIVRLHYEGGEKEDHKLLNGIHFADYIRRVDVPKSEFAFALRNQQIRYLTLYPKRTESIGKIEFVKGQDDSAPIVMAVTLESPD